MSLSQALIVTFIEVNRQAYW